MNDDVSARSGEDDKQVTLMYSSFRGLRGLIGLLRCMSYSPCLWQAKRDIDPKEDFIRGHNISPYTNPYMSILSMALVSISLPVAHDTSS